MTRTWRWWHLLLAGVGGVLVLALLVVVLMGVLLLRVLSDLGTSGPDEDDPQVVAARDSAGRELAADADRLSVSVLVPVLGPEARRVGRGQVLPPCDVGQHNWKIDDDYDLACDLHRLEVVAAPRRATFPADMRALDAALQEDGWVPSPVRDMEDELTARRGEVSATGGTSYTRSVAGSTRTLGIRWVVRDSAPDSVSWWAEDRERTALVTAEGETAHVSYLLAAVPVDGYAVVADESVEYFRE